MKIFAYFHFERNFTLGQTDDRTERFYSPPFFFQNAPLRFPMSYSQSLVGHWTTSSFSFRSGIAERKERASERENRLSRGNVTHAGARDDPVAHYTTSQVCAAGNFRARSRVLFARLCPTWAIDRIDNR